MTASDFRRTIPVFLALAFATSNALAQDDDIPDEWPEWLKESMKQEYKRAKYSPFSVGPLKGTLPGKIVNAEQIDDTSFYIAADDGTGTGYECWIWVDEIDLASTTSNITEAIIENVSAQNGPVNSRFIRAIDAGSLDGSPFLALEWLYTVGQEGQAQVAYTKVRTAEKNGAAITCGHSMPGYRKSFESSFARIVRDLEVDVDVSEPYYKELVVQSLNGTNIGVTIMQFTQDADGDTQISIDESTLAPISESELSISDTSSTAWSTPGGYLINKHYAAVNNNELTANLSIGADDEGRWSVSGTFNGKEIDADLGPDSEPFTELAYMQQVQGMFEDKGESSVTLTDWVPTIDPTSFLDVELGLDAGKGKSRTGKMAVGPLVVNTVFDKSGSMAEGEINIAGAKVLVERVFQQGEVE